MDRVKAYKLAIDLLSEYEEKGYDKLVELIGRDDLTTYHMHEGVTLTVDMLILWYGEDTIKLEAFVRGPNIFELDITSEIRIVRL